MTDYKKLVEALRICNRIDHVGNCNVCYYGSPDAPPPKQYVNGCKRSMCEDAADAIEALQAKVDKQDAEITELLAVITKNDTEMDNLKTELLNAQDEAKYERQRLRLCEENLDATQVSETTYREMCEALQAQLPKRGEWIYLYVGNYKCSVCGEWYSVDETPAKSGMNYCPNCGAKMEVQDADT